MADKNDIPVVINGRIYNLSGYENTEYLHNNGTPTKVGSEVTQHIQDFVACNPNPVVLRTLNNNRTITASVKKPKTIDNNNITTSLVVER